MSLLGEMGMIANIGEVTDTFASELDVPSDAMGSCWGTWKTDWNKNNDKNHMNKNDNKKKKMGAKHHWQHALETKSFLN